ncbi:hypothetical protein LCGC14_2476750, partial [marine sediment metagenome]
MFALMSDDFVYQYSLTTPWDVTTASYASKSFDVAEDTDTDGIFIRSDGLKMFISGSTNNKIFQYTLSTAWDISTASFDTVELDISLEETGVTDLFFKEDGTKMFIVGSQVDEVNEYALSTPWVVSSGTATSVFSVTAEDTGPEGIFFKDNGTRMFICGLQNNKIYQYSVSTPWDITTASYDNISFDVSTEDIFTQGIFFKPDGTKIFMVGTEKDKVSEYNLD